jgi:hypothetical protein
MMLPSCQRASRIPGADYRVELCHCWLTEAGMVKWLAKALVEDHPPIVQKAKAIGIEGDAHAPG